MGTTNNYAGGDVDGGGGVRNRRGLSQPDRAPPLHAHQPHCTFSREVGSRSGGGGDKDTMKDQATTTKHMHIHDKIGKTKKEVEIFSIMEEVENETWWDPTQVVTAKEDRHDEQHIDNAEVAALVAQTIDDAVQIALVTVVQDELQYAYDFSARAIEVGVRSTEREEEVQRELHAQRVARRKQLFLHRQQGVARAQQRRYEANIGKIESHTSAL